MAATAIDIRTPIQVFMERHAGLLRARAPYDEINKQIANLVLPWRAKFDLRQRGLAVNDAILDPTATYAARTCTAGMAAGFCSAARIWFRFGPPVALLAKDRRIAEKKTVKVYLADTEDVVRDILLRSNFYGATSGSAFYDLLLWGIHGVFAEEDIRTVMRLRPLPQGQFAAAANGDGEVDTVYRRFLLTVGQVVKSFGLQHCSSTVQDAYRNHQYEQPVTIIHLVEPNRRDGATGFEGMRSGHLGWEGMDYRSVWFEESGNDGAAWKFLRVSGYRDFPAVVPRWGKTSPEDVYGTGPGHEALPDIKQLQTMQKRKLQLIEKIAIPPLKGPDSLAGGIPSQLPGTYTGVPASAAGDRLEPIYVPQAQAVDQVRQEIQELRYAIREGLFADLWRLMTDDDRAQRATAEEIRAKREERLLQLGPVANNIEQEYLRKILDRAFNLADRAGLLPEPPPELEDTELKVEFMSIMSEAQRAQEIPAVERVASFIKALAEIDGDVLDNGDWDKFATKYAEIAGLSPDLMRDPEKVLERRAARTRQAEAEQEGQALLAATQGAKNLAGATLESDSALKRILESTGPVSAAQGGAGPSPLPIPGAIPGVTA